MGRVDKTFYFGLALLVYVALCYVHQKNFDAATPVSRLNVLHALFEEGTFRIDAYQDNTPDKAKYRDHYYSDKAPGIFVLALPAFGLAVAILNLLNIPLESDEGWFISSWIACAGSVAVVGALGAVTCCAWLNRWVSLRYALAVTLTLFLGAAPFPYATFLHAHTVEVAGIAIALWALNRSGRDGEHKQAGNRFVLLGGFSVGWVLASQLTAGLVVAGLFTWVIIADWRRGILFALGMVPPLLLIPIYSWVCFDTPWTIGYSHQAVFGQMQQGLFGIRWPDPITFLKLLFSPQRGLFFWSPFLLMAIPGYFRLIDRSLAFGLLVYGTFVVQTVTFSGYTWDWTAGYVLGPRYLSAILPLVALPAALAFARRPWIGGSLAFVSVVLTGTATLTNATPHDLF